MGYPITEPYWARVKIEGVYYDVLFQLYERRTLAYIPSFPKGWQVQMGNVGSHYYRWLYGGPLPSPVARVSSGVQVPTLPSSIDADISPQAAPLGTVLSVNVSGFQPQEDIVSWFTGPGGSAFDAQITGRAQADGTVRNLSVPTARLTAGVWAITFHGKASNHESIAYFYLIPPGDPTATPIPGATSTRPVQTPTRVPGGTSPTAVMPTVPVPQGTVTPTPTFPPVPTEPAGGLILSVRPGYGPPDGEFTCGISGMTPGEGIQVKFTDPDDNVVYPAGSNEGRYQADSNGRLSIVLIPAQAFPAAPVGVWLFEARGLQSGLEGVTGFTLR